MKHKKCSSTVQTFLAGFLTAGPSSTVLSASYFSDHTAKSGDAPNPDIVFPCPPEAKPYQWGFKSGHNSRIVQWIWEGQLGKRLH